MNYPRSHAQLDAFLNLIIDSEVGRTESRLFGGRMDGGLIWPLAAGLKTSTVAKKKGGGTYGGWFNHPADLIAATSKLRGVSTYVIPNPCVPDVAFLKVGDNNYGPVIRATMDKHIPYLRWMFVDFDFTRPSETSSTDEEVEQALARRDDFLGEWPMLSASVISGCSGNGACVLVRLPDLKNDAEGREKTKRMMGAVSRIYSDAVINIDVKCKNPARLMCLPGTLKCKGENTPERPWRLATMEGSEGDPVPVPTDPVEFLAKLLERSPEPLVARRNKLAMVGGGVVSGSAMPSHFPASPSDDGAEPICPPASKKTLRQAGAYLRKKSGGIQGKNGSGPTFDAACVLRKGYAFTFEEAMPILRRWSDETCVPTWSEDELKHKLDSAYEKEDGPSDKPRGHLRLSEASAPPGSIDHPVGAADEDGRFTIMLTDDERKVVDDCEWMISIDESIYQQGGQLVHTFVIPGEDAGGRRLRITPATYPIIRDKLSGHIEFKQECDDKWRTVPPPTYAPSSLIERKTWPKIRYLNGIVHSPTIRLDGTLLCQPGYDDVSKLIYDTPENLGPIDWRSPIATGPENAEILLGLVGEFPWPDRRHAVAWLSSVLTLVARYWINGTAPMFVADANSSGAGKSHLAQIGSLIARGTPATLTSYSANDEEMRKRVTALAIGRHSMCLMDNIDRPLGGASLDAALTSRNWSDRILCSSTMAIDVPLNITWFATGNNVSIVGDVARRVVYMRLDSPHDRPAEHGGYRIKDILGHVAAERATYLKAAIDIIRGYVAAGSPTFDFKTFGSFERWSTTVRSAVYWATGVDPLDTRTELANQDDGQIETEALIARWSKLPHDGTGIKVRDAVELMKSDNSRFGDLLQLCRELAGSQSGEIDTKRLGIELKKRLGKNVAGITLRRQNYGGTMLWSTEFASPQPESLASCKAAYP
ncbi:hypothetical protein EP7_002042 [Isosphaeraceae bacterium EP7]